MFSAVCQKLWAGLFIYTVLSQPQSNIGDAKKMASNIGKFDLIAAQVMKTKTYVDLVVCWARNDGKIPLLLKASQGVKGCKKSSIKGKILKEHA